jgi:phosphoglucomutase
MSSDRAGTPAQPDDLVDVARLITAYYTEHPDPDDPAQQVSFGTSGHRGSSFKTSFNDDHIAATTQAICEYRAAQGIDGPLVIGRDTHGLSEPSYATALEVLVANDVTVLVDVGDGFVPTPAISHAILALNAQGRNADGIVVTPSHNPPTDGGFKYNPPNGGPADTAITGWVQDRANDLLRAGGHGIKRIPLSRARAQLQTFDFIADYVDDLPTILDIDAIRSTGVHIGADPLGGASVAYWSAIAERLGLNLDVVNPRTDPQFAFMTLDWDGKIRMDCSSPHAMASLVAAKDQYQVATGNDADADRHGIVTPDAGLMNPNHYLAVAIDYLLGHRPDWDARAAVGKTLVSSAMIDRVVAGRGRNVLEVPVGFKWFVPGLRSGDVVFGGEESAGASFLRKDGTTWTTDKDGILLALLASEIIATTGESPSQHYTRLTEQYGASHYARIDAPADREQKARLAGLTADQVAADELAGDPITAVLTNAPGNEAPIGGLKVQTDRAWFAARPSGTEDVYKIYAESWVSADHLAQVQRAARELVTQTLA